MSSTCGSAGRGRLTVSWPLPVEARGPAQRPSRRGSGGGHLVPVDVGIQEPLFFFFLMESHVSRQRTGVDQSLCHQQSPNTPGRGTGPRAPAAPPAFRALPSPSGALRGRAPSTFPLLPVFTSSLVVRKKVLGVRVSRPPHPLGPRSGCLSVRRAPPPALGSLSFIHLLRISR